MIFLPLCAKISLFSLSIRLFSPPLHRPQLTRKGLLWHLLIKRRSRTLSSVFKSRKFATPEKMRCRLGACVWCTYLHIAFLNMQRFIVIHRVAVVSYPQE